MVRIQVELTSEQMTHLLEASEEGGVSVEALICKAIDRIQADRQRADDWARAFSVVGKYRDKDGATDVAARHDDYLADAYEDWRR